MTLVDDGFLKGETLFIQWLKVLIADGVHEHARMVAIAFNHRGDVLTPMIRKIKRVVVPVLALVPHIPHLIDQIHAVMVAGPFHRLGAGIVRGAYRVVSQ